MFSNRIYGTIRKDSACEKPLRSRCRGFFVIFSSFAIAFLGSASEILLLRVADFMSS